MVEMCAASKQKLGDKIIIQSNFLRSLFAIDPEIGDQECEISGANLI